MSTIEPGWFKDPVDPSVQRYWDGEGWLGDPLPIAQHHVDALFDRYQNVYGQPSTSTPGSLS